MRILLCNDDGIEADGIQTLREALVSWGAEVTVVAPEREQSGTSHAISLRQPLYLQEVSPGQYSVSGTPVDTMNFAINFLMKDNKPDLVVSGINRGANLGCDINYSGTAGAAREACMLGVNAIAVSLNTLVERPDFAPAARFTARLIEMIGHIVFPPRSFINVNIPDLAEDEIRGVRITTQGVRQYNNAVTPCEDEKGRVSYVIGGVPEGGIAIPDSDIAAIEAGYISITPLRLDTTHECAMEWLRSKLNHGGLDLDEL